MEKITGIYKITNPKGRVYIGQSVDIYARWYSHKNKPDPKQKKLYNSFSKYGSDKHVFEIIIQCDKDQLNELERYYQDLYSAITQSGLNGCLTKTDEKIKVYSEEYKENLRNSHLGHKDTIKTRCKKRLKMLDNIKSGKFDNKKNIGKKTSTETKLKISNSHKNKIKSKKHIENLRIAKLRREVILENERNNFFKPKRTLSKVAIEKIRQSKLNMSEEYRAKLSAASKGRKFTEKQKIRLSISHANQKNENLRIPVLQYDLNNNFLREFESVSDAARQTRGSEKYNSNIVVALKKPNRTCFGFKWKYKQQNG